MKRILIIGCKGFIGKALFTQFSTNAVVYGADIIPQPGPNYFFINAQMDYDDIFQKKQFDYCINASGAADVNLSIVNPAWDYELNHHNVFKMLDAIRKFNPGCKFLQISSAAVYGNPEILPVNEKTPVKPLSPYGFHKRQSELLCEEFSAIYSIQTVIVRIFSAYGPGLKKQLFWDLHKKASLQNPIELFGTGEESRDFVFIGDIVNAIEKLISNNSGAAEIYNLAGGKEIRIRKAVEIFLKFSGNKNSFRFSNAGRAGDPLNWRADISKLKSIGYEPKVSLEEGIKKYCKWLKEI